MPAGQSIIIKKMSKPALEKFFREELGMSKFKASLFAIAASTLLAKAVGILTFDPVGLKLVVADTAYDAYELANDTSDLVDASSDIESVNTSSSQVHFGSSYDEPQYEECYRCSGTGHRPCSRCSSSSYYQGSGCSWCGYTGWVDCTWCGGDGNSA